MVTGAATSIRLAAMNLLARREHSRQELTQKLSRRFPNESAQISVEVDKLRGEGLQSDARMAESFIRSRISRGQGPIKISVELQGRGVSEQLTKRAIEDAGVDWLALVVTVCERKFGTPGSVDLKEKARRMRFLQQRGFTFDQINAVLGNHGLNH